MLEMQYSENHSAIMNLFAENSKIKDLLGKIIGEITPVSGGLMHKMYKVQTDKGTYAVKCLNPEIMKRPEAFENYTKAEALEDILEENDIPIVPALSFDEKKDICDELNKIVVRGKCNG